MRKLSHNIRVSVFTCLFLGASLAVAGAAHAVWYYTHGNSGHVQDDNLVVSYPNYLGWGLDFALQPGNYTWVQYAVPTLGGGSKGVRYIRLKFFTGSADAWVSQIDVYDNEILFQTVTGHWANGTFDIQLNLGQVWRINRGLGISIRVHAGVENMDHRFVFESAGANFVNFVAPTSSGATPDSVEMGVDP